MDKKVLKKRCTTEDQALAYINTLSFFQIKELLVDYLMQETEAVQKITISAEDFEKHFRIKESSGEGRRGRPRKED